LDADYGGFQVGCDRFSGSLTERQYELGIRAHFISTHREEENVIPIKAKVELREVVVRIRRCIYRMKGYV